MHTHTKPRDIHIYIHTSSLSLCDSLTSTSPLTLASSKRDPNYYIQNNPFKKEERLKGNRLKWIIGECQASE